jgi:hypothetical protein
MSPILQVFVVVFLLSCVPAVIAYAAALRRYTGDRILICPETGQAQAVRVDARHAASTALAGEALLRLDSCTRWPERRDCGQECLAQIETAPDGCLVRSRLERWYAGARCCLCGDVFAPIPWFDRKPGLRSPEGRAVSWEEIRPAELPILLSTHRPLCFDCLVAETFRRRFPDRIVEDPRPPVRVARGRPRPAA